MIGVYKGDHVDISNFMAHVPVAVISHWLDISCENHGLVYVGY